MRIVLLLIFCMLMSCADTADESNERGLAIIEIRQTLDSYTNDIRDKGLQSEFRYLDSGADFFWVPPGYAHALSYDSVRAAINRNADLFKRVDNTWDTLRIIPLSGKLANYTGVLKSDIKLLNDSIMHYKMIETGTLIKRANGWKLLSGQTSVLTN